CHGACDGCPRKDDGCHQESETAAEDVGFDSFHKSPPFQKVQGNEKRKCLPCIRHSHGLLWHRYPAAVCLCRSRISRSSCRSVVISSFSRADALNSTVMLLLFVDIRPLPRWKCVMFITSVSERCRICFTRCASSSSRFRTSLVLQLFMIPFPYLPSSRAKKSFKSCVAKTAEPPYPRIILAISRTNSAARRLLDAPMSCQTSSTKMAFSSVRFSFAISQT